MAESIKPNSMSFDIDNYKNAEDMWKDIGKFLQILIHNDNIAVVRYDDCGIYVVEYEHDENHEAYGYIQPVWVDPDKVIYAEEVDEEEDN